MKQAGLRRRLWWEARFLPLRVLGRDFAGLLALANRPLRNVDAQGLPVTEIVAAVVTATRRPWMMRNRRCLRQGLLAFRALHSAGHRPALHFGVDAAGLKDRGGVVHCWIVIGDEVVLNPPNPGMTTVFIHSLPDVG